MTPARALSCLLLAGLSLACDATCLRDSDCARASVCVADRCVLPRADGGSPEAGADGRTEGPPSSSLPDPPRPPADDPLDAGGNSQPGDSSSPGSPFDAAGPDASAPDADAAS